MFFPALSLSLPLFAGTFAPLYIFFDHFTKNKDKNKNFDEF